MSAKQSLLHFCIAIIHMDDRFDVALLDSSGKPRDNELLSGQRVELMRLLRRWNRAHGLDPHKCLFCILGNDHAALSLIAAPMRPEVLLWRFEPEEIRLELGLLPKTKLTAAMVAEYAFLFARAARPAGAVLLQHRRLDLLVARRDELLRFKREGLGHGLRSGQMDADLRKEFERMDRRHVRVLDAIIGRLDALIAAQMARDPDGDHLHTLPVTFGAAPQGAGT